MKILMGGKDGGPDSKVRMWGIESKKHGSLLLLRFDGPSREAYHSHAFNAWSWLLRGCLIEETKVRATSDGRVFSQCFDMMYEPSVKPIYTDANTMHKVHGFGVAWALTVRTGWLNSWLDWPDTQDKPTRLTWGRGVL